MSWRGRHISGGALLDNVEACTEPRHFVRVSTLAASWPCRPSRGTEAPAPHIWYLRPANYVPD